MFDSVVLVLVGLCVCACVLLLVFWLIGWFFVSLGFDFFFPSRYSLFY